MELFEQGLAVLRLANMVHQAHAENAIHCVVRQVDGKGRRLQRTNPLDDFLGLRFAGNLQHIG
ncbi:hypothetical protein D3C72_2482220 [compost metagenome]